MCSKWEICKPHILQNYHLEKVHPYHGHYNLTYISRVKKLFFLISFKELRLAENSLQQY